MFKCDEERLLLDKFTIVERDRTRRVFNWLQHLARGQAFVFEFPSGRGVRCCMDSVNGRFRT